MIVIGILIVVVLLFIANKLSNIKENMHWTTHNTAKLCEHLFDIKNKLAELQGVQDIEGHLISIDNRVEGIANELSDFAGKANFKWGFSEHYPGEK